MTNKYSIDDILNAIVDEKPVDLQAGVNALMVDKAHDSISGLKSVLVQDMLGDKKADDAEDTEDDIDHDVDVEDDTEELDAEELFTDDNEEK